MRHPKGVAVATFTTAASTAVWMIPHYSSGVLLSLSDALMGFATSSAVATIVALAATGAILALLLRHLAGQRLDRVGDALWLAVSMLASTYYASLYSRAGILAPVAMPAVVLALLAATFVMLKKYGGGIYFGALIALLGPALASSMSRCAAFAALTLLAIYDYLMYRAKALDAIASELLRGQGGVPQFLLIRVCDVAFGSGDFLAYSMMLSIIAAEAWKFGMPAPFAAIAAASAALYASILASYRVFLRGGLAAPALPIPTAVLLPAAVALWLAQS